MLIKEDERNRGKWKIGIVDQLITGRDGVVRVAKLRAGASHLERALQQLYPLELKCDRDTRRAGTSLNANAEEFNPPERTQRRAAQEARDRLAVIDADAGNDF